MFRKSKFIGSLWPTPASATLAADGVTLTVVMTGRITADSGETAAQWVLTGTSSTVSSVAADGTTTVVLTLNEPVLVGSVLTLAYTAGANPMTSVYLTRTVYNFTGLAVTDLSTQTLPVKQSIVAPSAGTSVVITYDKAMDSGSIPAASDCALAGTSAVLADPAVISGMTVTFPVTGHIYQGQTVTFSYTKGTNPIQDTAGNNAANLVTAAVTNNSTQDNTPPVKQSIAIPSAGTSIVITYNEALDTGSTPAATDCALGGTSAVLADPGIVSGTTVTFPITGPVYQGETVTFSYTAGTNKIRDLAHNNAANLVAAAVTNGSTQDAPPVLVSMVIPSAGTSAVLTYDKALDTGSTPAATDFALDGVHLALCADPVVVVGTTVTIPVDGPFLQGEIVAVAYTAGTHPIQDVAGTDAANINYDQATNNSTQVVGEFASGHAGDILATQIELIYTNLGDGNPVQLSAIGSPTLSQWSFTGDISGAHVPTSCSLATIGKIILGFAVPFVNEVITGDYTRGAIGVKDSSGNFVADLVGVAIENDIT